MERAYKKRYNGCRSLLKIIQESCLEELQDRLQYMDALIINRGKLLIVAVQTGVTCIVKELLSVFGVNVNIKEFGHIGGFTPLMYAADKNYTEILKLLLEQDNIDVNICDRFSGTALCVAVRSRHIECIKLLLGNTGTAINTSSKNVPSPIILAITHDYIEGIELFLKDPRLLINYRGLQYRTPLMYAAVKTSTKISKMILAQPGVDVDATTMFSYSAIKFAGRACNTEQVKLLLIYGTKPCHICQSQSMAVRKILTNWRRFLPSWRYRGAMAKYYPHQFRACMFTWCLISKRLKLPKDIEHLIIEYTADAWKFNSKLPKDENYL